MRRGKSGAVKGSFACRFWFVRRGLFMGPKLVLIASAFFVYLYAPHGMLPNLPHAPHAFAAVAGMVMVGPLIYHVLRS